MNQGHHPTDEGHERFVEVGQNGYPNIWSFTSLYHPENRTKTKTSVSKTQRLGQILYKKGHNTINIGVPTNSNTNIVRGLIFHGIKC